jgi:uncharacterized cupin superfamily protein
MSMPVSTRPDFIKHVSELPDNGGTVWAGSDEVLAIRTPLSRPLGLVRIGVHHEVLEPGHRSALPHAEPIEEECVYVLEGHPHAWIEGEEFPLSPNDIVVYEPGTGTRHCIINHTDQPVRLLIIGERLVVPAEQVVAFATWLRETHPEVENLLERSEAERLALADAFEGGALSRDPTLRETWRASLHIHALHKSSDQPGYPEAGALLMGKKLP